MIMKKLLLLLMAAMLLPLASRAVTLEPNQRVMGHYTSDALATTGWGQAFLYDQVLPIATDITPDELALFQGGKIVAFRVGLVETAPVSRVFVIPVDANGKPTSDVTEWSCDVSSVGWNMIELATPYEINLPDGYGLRIGFDYVQYTRTSKPISAVNEGTVYPSLIYRNNSWMNYGVNVRGNLSVQCIVENDNFPQYIIKVQDLVSRSNVKQGDELAFSFTARNLGDAAILAGDVTFDVSVDGVVVKTISNPEALGFAPKTIAGSVNTDGMGGGMHTIAVSLATIKGEPVENPATMTATFNVFEFGFSRQLHLIEQFTSTTCTWCPTGTNNIRQLTEMRGDIAWVAIHNVQNNSNPDPFRTAQADSLMNFEGLTGWPEASFDRTAGIESSNSIMGSIAGISPSNMSTFLDYVDGLEPSWATVNVNSTFDPESRQAVITIDGETVPNFEECMGGDAKLTVYITEDGLVYPQTSGGSDYVHNNVLRQALVSVKGVALNKTGNTYKNVFSYTIPEAWDADNLNIVAFISRPLRSNALTDLRVTNANKRKLGEFDEVTVVRGDVDGDGKVTIDDLAELVDCLLTGEAASQGADCDLDGEVSIDDVAALVDFLLSNAWGE